MAIVPSTTRVRRSRVANIDTDRLMRRQAHIVGLADAGFRDARRRVEMVDLARELFAIENELDARAVSYTRRTLTAAISDALSTPN